MAFPGADSKPCKCELGLYSFGATSFARIESGTCDLEVAPLDAVHRQQTVLRILWIIEGSCMVRQAGASIEARPGDLCVSDMQRSAKLSFAPNHRMAALYLPVAERPEWQSTGISDVPRAFAADVAGRAALAALESLPKHSEDVSAKHVLDAAADLVWTSVLHGIDPGVDHCARPWQRLQAARRYIMRHLEDPGLDVMQVAAALHLSRRSLYVLLARYGVTAAELIRTLRLEQTRYLLADPRQRGRSLADIAAQFAFADASHFSRAFRGRFGVSPGHWRRSTML